ncbi:RING-type E3 ubiquitin transferase [Aphelenchoides bicaudatus]|nr:RING-type E3 ubiquitin transferase [Aphelenchoides bicaudatus]
MKTAKRCKPFQCPICYDMLKNPSMLPECLHVFCYACIEAWIDAQRQNPNCPFCRQKIDGKNRIIRLQPKFSGAEYQQQLTNKNSLEELQQNLAKKTALYNETKAICDEKDEKNRAEFDALKNGTDLINKSIEPTISHLETYKRKFEKERLKLTPRTAPYFDKIYAEVMKNPTKTESHDEIRSAWQSARNHYERHRKLEEQVSETKQQISEVSKGNMASRALINSMGPEELSRRHKRRFFEEVCKLMHWDHKKYQTKAEDSDDDDAPIYVKRPRISEPDASKRPWSILGSDLLDMDFS